jgi:hypothetical protein
MCKNIEEKQTKVCILHQSQPASLAFEPFAQAAAAFCNTHDFKVKNKFEKRRRAPLCGLSSLFLLVFAFFTFLLYLYIVHNFFARISKNVV